MAKAAQSLFTTAVIAKIGDDELTQLIKDQAGRIDADWHLIVDAQTANGLVVIVRDAADEKHGGNRLLVSGLPAPGLRISTADIHTEALLIEQSDVLMIDGYSLLSQSGREALMEALKLAGGAGTLRCLDLVPHNIHELFEYPELAEFLGHADIVISNARTLAALLGERVGYPLSRAGLRPLLEHVRRLGLPPQYWILRFGVGDTQDTVILRPEQEPIYYETGYVETDDHAGFGDRLAAWELYQILNHRIVD